MPEQRGLTINKVEVTPVAFHDPPLLNVIGVHEPYALRGIVVIHTDAGLGLGETYGDSVHLARLRRVADALVGVDAFDTNGVRAITARVLGEDTGQAGAGMSGMVTTSSTLDRVFAPFEVACLDAHGKALGLSVAQLLGGVVRDEVPYGGYLFYKWAGHPGAEDDEYGEALTPEGIVEQARRMGARYGFTGWKLKGGVFPPAQEVAAIHALREAFPDAPLRIDPNGAWTVETSVKVGLELAGVLEYLEDPTPGIGPMAEVARRVPMPLATNQAVVSFADLVPGIAAGAAGVILGDLHFWGGMRRSAVLAGICETWGLGLSMHSNSHLGISLAAMTHLGAATPQLTYALDTHWPWKQPDEDVVVHDLRFAGGAIAVPTAPGLGVELDPDALARQHRLYETCGQTERNDTAYMRRTHPEFDPSIPRW